MSDKEVSKSSKTDRRGGSAPGTEDVLFDEAVRIVFERGRGSVALLQRRLDIGYTRASRMFEKMTALGILGEFKGHALRNLAMTQAEYEAKRTD